MRKKTTTARLGKFDGSLRRAVRSYDAHIEVKLRLARALKQKEKNGVRRYHLSADLFTATPTVSYLGFYPKERSLLGKLKSR